jgi:hypothetical protein
LFYNGPLLEALDRAGLPITPVGFADDINILAYGPTTSHNCRNLQASHDICLEWARKHGMRFALAKYTLTHFAKSCKFDMNAPVTLGETVVSLEPSVKVLGVILDSKLKWKDHEQAVKQKLATQMLALQRTTASTWGATMLKARQVYQAVVRPAMAYGAPA